MSFTTQIIPDLEILGWEDELHGIVLLGVCFEPDSGEFWGAWGESSCGVDKFYGAWGWKWEIKADGGFTHVEEEIGWSQTIAPIREQNSKRIFLLHRSRKVLNIHNIRLEIDRIDLINEGQTDCRLKINIRLVEGQGLHFGLRVFSQDYQCISLQEFSFFDILKEFHVWESYDCHGTFLGKSTMEENHLTLRIRSVNTKRHQKSCARVKHSLIRYQGRAVQRLLHGFTNIVLGLIGVIGLWGIGEKTLLGQHKNVLVGYGDVHDFLLIWDDLSGEAHILHGHTVCQDGDVIVGF